MGNTKIIEANKVKASDDKDCEGTYSSRQKIVAGDQKIVNQLDALNSKLDELGSRGSQPTAFLEIRAKVHANYDALLTEKKSEITQWNQQCDRNRGSYTQELADTNKAASQIRDTTEDRHGKVFAKAKAEADEDQAQVVSENAALVSSASDRDVRDKEDYAQKHADHLQKEENFGIVTDAVTEERADAVKVQKEENAATEATRVGDQKEYKATMESTIATAGTERDGTIAECDSSFKSRTKLIDDDLAVLGEIGPLLSKLKACKGDTSASLLEIANLKASAVEKMSCAAAGKRYRDLSSKSSSLLETKNSEPTEGNLSEFHARVDQEKIEAGRVRDVCTADAHALFGKKQAAAIKLHGDRVITPDNSAEKATSITNATFKAESLSLDGRLKAARDPHLAATKADELAQSAMEEAARLLSSAKATEKEEVDEATATQEGLIADAKALRDGRIKEDRAEAKAMDEEGARLFKQKTDAENAKCKAENAALSSEESSLATVITRMKELAKAHEGLSGSDKTTLAEDIADMNTALNKERDSSEVDRTECLRVSKQLHQDTSDAANGVYNKAEAALQAVHDTATGKAENKKAAKDASHNAREETNDTVFGVATKKYNGIKEDNANAQAEHVTALALQKSEMHASHAHLLDAIKRAPQEKQNEIDSYYAQAAIQEDANMADHVRRTSGKEDECEAERDILKDERKQLRATRKVVAKLVVVRDDNSGVGNDYTTTTTEAPTWERL